jgi:hypothetical protein
VFGTPPREHFFAMTHPNGHSPDHAPNRRVPSRPSIGSKSGSLPPNRRQPSHPGPAHHGPGQGKPRRGRSAATLVGAILGVIVGASALATITWASGCGSEAPPPGPSTEAPALDPMASLPAPPVPPDDSNQPVAEEPELPAAPAADKPYEGPWLGALAQSTPIYPTARLSRNRLGYIRRGGKVPVIDKPIKTDSCKQGFYPLVDGGYVCGKYATTNVQDPRVKAGVKEPNMDALLPYRYAYNTAHGTPLYNAVPSREEMLRFEPYLRDKNAPEASKEQAEKEAESADRPRTDPLAETKDPPIVASADPALFPPPSDDAGAPAAEGAGGQAPEEKPKGPWWQPNEGAPVDVKLSELDEADGALQKRMVKGFFIAVDRTFGSNNRMWYQTTDGLVAPAERMIIPKTPEHRGFEIPDGVTQVGFIRSVSASKYDFPEGAKSPKKTGKLARYAAFGLTGKTKLHDKQRYRETTDGWWMNESQGAYTDAGSRPSEVGADEKWIDVNLARKTLVAFVGDKPVYAALVAPGKSSSNKAQDHRTKTGKWRIREKHIATTMDGDGPSGDLPYSIQDVPYVQYYDGSYALHGAFWHNNFGREQSHGCVNLAPADAKYLFGWTEPSLPRGWHGVWASEKRKGTLVVIHE